MALAKIDIANSALRLLGDSELNSLDDGSAQAARISSAWNASVEYVLSRHAWAFALRRAELARASFTVPGYAHVYAVPADNMRLVSVFTTPDFPLAAGSWRMEGGHILCHAPRAACLYVHRQMDVSTWSPGFCATLAAYLASVVARPLSRTEMAPVMEQLFRQHLDAARLDDTAHQPEAPAHAVATSVMAARLGCSEHSAATESALNYPLSLENIR